MHGAAIKYNGGVSVTDKAVLYVTGYALLFLLFGVMWLAVFFRGGLTGRKTIYLSAISTGALAFILALSIQTPIQIYANNFFSGRGASLWTTGAIVVLISGLVQEAFKGLAIWLNRFIMREEIDWLSLGLAVGFGFGVWEAWRLVAYELGRHSIWFPLAIMERFTAIGLHIGLAFIVAYGLSKRQPWRYFLLAAVWHGAVNYLVVCYQGRLFGIWPTEIGSLIMALAAVIFASWLYRRPQPTD